ncbi:MAG: UDP-N-acetylmuramoyl-tripeptide--D-alanyl-D-alanine ligase [Deltaproteobacteria bacterium]|nr:UDP-N-acetylmuramoyl-tripeptide--D-alanyl-D-alanine ligase [Deltaproteobacteria bacterium]
MNLTQNDILKAVKGKFLFSETGKRVAGISTDTRTVRRGDLFIPLKGVHYEAHSFLAEAFKKGAVGALVEKNSGNHLRFRHRGIFLIQVVSTLEALGDLAAFWRRRFKIAVVAITGSNGKTTTKDMTSAILGEKYSVLKTEGNLNNLIGLPQTLFRLTQKHDVAVVEMGMNAPGEIDRLAEIAAPQIGVITSVGRAHLQGLGTLRAVARAKGELLRHLPKTGTAVLNADDSETIFLQSLCRSRRVTFGFKKKPTYRAKKINFLEDQLQFSLEKGQKKQVVKLACISEAAISNALAALAVGDLLSVPWSRMARALHRFHPASNRMELLSIGSQRVLNDTYNANPDSMIIALQTLHRLASKMGRRRVIHPKVAILGEMLELGKFEKEGHLEVGRMAALCGLDLLITVGRKARLIAEGARRGGLPPEKIHSFDDYEEAAQEVPQLLGPKDLILLKGSRGTRMERFLELIPRKKATS